MGAPWSSTRRTPSFQTLVEALAELEQAEATPGARSAPRRWPPRGAGRARQQLAARDAARGVDLLLDLGLGDLVRRDRALLDDLLSRVGARPATIMAPATPRKASRRRCPRSWVSSVTM